MDLAVVAHMAALSTEPDVAIQDMIKGCREGCIFTIPVVYAIFDLNDASSRLQLPYAKSIFSGLDFSLPYYPPNINPRDNFDVCELIAMQLPRNSKDRTANLSG
jgi:hypothetical protein